MEPFRLKLKIGPHEFEAEGDQETVERQFAIWRELIASPSASPPAAPSPPPSPAGPATLPRNVLFGGIEVPFSAPATPAPDPAADDRAQYSKIFKHDGRVVSLTAQPSGANRIADSLLLLLLGQLVFNGTEPVTGQQLSDGMEVSGIKVDRVDRAWGPHMDTNVLRSGVNRGVRYRLSNPGLARAREIAKELLQLVA